MFIMRSAKILVLAFLLTLASNSFAQKMTPDEIIAKHLDSIGPKEKRELIKNQLILADIEFEGAGGAGVFGGKAVIFSARDKNVWGMNINANNAGMDRFGYNGKNTKVGFIRPGVRSVLGTFIQQYGGKLMEESLLGGALANSWAFYKLDSKKPKLNFEGTKKIDGKDTYVLSYAPKGGSEIDIRIFFDSQTFRHVRTEYGIYKAAALGSINTSAGRDSNRYSVVETFSDFKTMGDLTLPSSYKINYSFFGGSSTEPGLDKNRDVDWRFKVTNFSFNQESDDKDFDIDAK